MSKSQQMARVRSRNTAPELALRRALWAQGKRYRLHADLPGTPDLVFITPKLAVFVDGCFWHGCPVHYTAPAANSGFWQAKLERNLARDRHVDQALSAAGWSVLRIWEHEIRESLDACAQCVTAALETLSRAEPATLRTAGP